MAKVIFKKIKNCEECPYFRTQSAQEYAGGDWESWYECGFTDKILISFEDLEIYQKTKDERYPFDIPEWCPLEEEDVFTKAIEAVKSEEEKI